MEEIKVSVFCTAYNHGKYIRQCLEGFVMQKTNFKFEVFVHDDASTDNTAQIIREYAEKHPDIIKPIYQTENQYSKGNKITRNILFPMSTGKYIAFCEGDDCWIDPDKLQIQYDFMEKNKKYSACSHRTKVEYIAGGMSISPNFKRDRNISFQQIVFNGMIETSSFFMKREVYENIPKEFRAKSFGDYQLFLYSSTCGKIKCFHKIMSLYRKGVPGSWSDKTRSQEQIYNFYCEHIELAQKMIDYYDNKKYRRILEKKKNLLMTYNFIYKEDGQSLKKQPYKSIYKKVNLKKKRKVIRNKVFGFLKNSKFVRLLRGKNGKSN